MAGVGSVTVSLRKSCTSRYYGVLVGERIDTFSS
jgi:hypothetical protein